jgi:hypothetical protein
MSPDFEPILLHYHYLAEVQYQERLWEVLTWIGCSSEVLEWIENRLSFFNPKEVKPPGSLLKRLTRFWKG